MRHTKFIKMAMRKTHAQHQERNKIADMAIHEHVDEFIARSIGWSVELQGVTVVIHFTTALLHGILSQYL